MGKLSQAKTDKKFGYRQLTQEPQQRLDVNNLLNRIKVEKNKYKKTNIFILTGTAFIVLVFVTLTSI